MRPGVAIAVLFLTAAASTAQEPTQKVITQPDVEVRSGPSFNYYATSVLRQGEVVEVVGQGPEPNWLSIRPPRGSFSWIDAAHVTRNKEQPSLGTIISDVPAPVMPGSSLTNKAPNVEQVKLEKGTQVVILDEAFSPAGGGSFFPIQPPATEVRYIPIEAVKPQQFVGSPTAPNPLPTGIGNGLIQQADKALQSGNVEKAKQLYMEAGRTSKDRQEQIYCWNRLSSLASGPTGSPGHPDQTQGVAMMPSGHLSGGANDALFKTAQIQRGTTQQPQWSTWGVLRRAAFKSEDGQPMYVLENQKGGAPLLYVTPQAGMSLANYIGRTVCLYGPITYRSDDYMRMHHMVASHIALP